MAINTTDFLKQGRYLIDTTTTSEGTYKKYLDVMDNDDLNISITKNGVPLETFVYASGDLGWVNTAGVYSTSVPVAEVASTPAGSDASFVYNSTTEAMTVTSDFFPVSFKVDAVSPPATASSSTLEDFLNKCWGWIVLIIFIIFLFVSIIIGGVAFMAVRRYRKLDIKLN